MKKTLLSVIYFALSIFPIQAQTLYGTSFRGGNDGGGTINRFNPASNNLTVARSFDDSISGFNPLSSLVQASDGKLYGTTFFGGINNYGVIFSFDPSSSTYTKLKDFDYDNGVYPYGSLVQADDGKLYGVTSYGGGGSSASAIFSFDPSSLTYTWYNVFDDTNGYIPSGYLLKGNDGKLYGVTNVGGSNGFGVIFSFDPSSSTYTKLKDFDNAIGVLPSGNLVQTSDGKLYGTTASTFFGIRPSGNGVIFSYDLSSSTYTVLKYLDDVDGTNPSGSLVNASDGKLYGITVNGGTSDSGVVFSFDPFSSTYTKLKDFDNAGGSKPSALMQASDGKLYGTTVKGGANGLGVIFSFDLSSSTYTKLQDYTGINGADASSAFIEVKGCIADTAYYRDADGDGYGDPNNSIKTCRQPAGYVKNNYDCDDHDRIHQPRNKRVIMCRHNIQRCVKAKDIRKMLRREWTLGPCITSSCSTAIKEQWLKTKDTQKKLPETVDAATIKMYKVSSYPNPFVGISTIKYELPVDSKVSIKVYDLMGRVVAVLVEGDKKAGIYTADFNAGHISRGTLYYRIIATSKNKRFEQTNKMTQLQ